MKAFSKFFLQNILAIGMIVALTTTALGISQAQSSVAISNVAATEISTSSATINWQTDTVSDSEVRYGTSSSNYSSRYIVDEDTTSHSIKLAGLSKDTTYFYRVKSRTDQGGEAESDEYNFKTLTGDGQELSIANVKTSNLTHEQFTITWDTNQPADSQVYFGTTTNLGSTYLNKSMVSAHSATLYDLQPQTVYYYQVASTDSQSNTAKSDIKQVQTTASPDTQAPVISNIKASNVQQTSADISWKTNEPANSWVAYGTTTQYGSGIGSEQLVTEHKLSLTGLQPATTYHYQVASKDASGNKTTSSDQTFTTAQSQGSSETRVDYALNGTLTTNAATAITVNVLHASSSAKSTIGTHLNIQITDATVITQDGKQVNGDQLKTGSKINVNGYAMGNVYYANRIESHMQHFVLSGTVQSVDSASGQLTLRIKVTTPPYKSYLGKDLTIKTDQETIIRVNRYYGTLSDIPTGKMAQVMGTAEGMPLADRIVILFR